MASVKMALLAILTVSLSSSYRNFGKTLAISLNISKDFDSVWHKALISKCPHTFSIFPSATLSQASSPTVLLLLWLMASVLLLNLLTSVLLRVLSYLLFIIYLLNQTSCSIYYYPNDTFRHFSTSFQKRPTLRS